MQQDLRDDRTLMTGLAEGDTTALQALYDRHAGQVMVLCLRILRDRARAEEVVGDVFWELWDRADRYRPDRGAPIAYVMTLARSRAIDRLRSRAATHRDAGPFESAAASELSVRIRRALSGLSDAERRAVEMSFFDGLSHGEIADALREPLGTVKSRIRQGLLRLRDVLAGEYGTMGTT